MIIFFIDVVSVILWLILLKKLDGNADLKGNSGVQVLFLVGGMASVVPAMVFYRIYPVEIRAEADPVAAFYQNVGLVGPYEEFAKFLVFFVISRWRNTITEVRDGMIQAASVALGFAAVENFQYGMSGGVAVMAVRSVLCIAGHMVYASIWGFFTAYVLFEDEDRRGPVHYMVIIASLVPAAVLHGVYDFLLDIEQPLAAVGLKVMIVLAAFHGIRRLGQDSPYRLFPLSDHARAISVIGKALRLNPFSAILNRRMALYCLRAGEYGRAVRYLDRCIRIDSGNPAVRCYRAMALVAAGREDEGRTIIDETMPVLSPFQKKAVMTNALRVMSREDVRHRVLGFLSAHDTRSDAVSGAGFVSGVSRND